MLDKTFYTIVGLMVTTVFILIATAIYNDAKAMKAPCEELDNTRVELLPARCLEFYKGGVTSI